MDAPTKSAAAKRQSPEQQGREGMSVEVAENRAHRLVGELQGMLVFFSEEMRRMLTEIERLRQEADKCKSARAPDVPFGTTAPAETSAPK